MSENTKRIRSLNDNFRRSFSGGQVVATQGIDSLCDDAKLRLFRAVRTFDQFTEDNDPHAEHDFGSVELDDQMFFFKIDYYDPSGEYGSEDPSDPTVTKRVLTLMLAEEY